MHKERCSVGLVDVGIGNIQSVGRALDYFQCEFEYCKEPETLQGKSHVILPGVGAFGAGMEALHKAQMVAPLQKLAADRETYILGICLGMQLLGGFGEEGGCDGLGLVDFKTEHLQARASTKIKVPNVGFSEISLFQPSGLFLNIDQGSDVYFTHSYAVRQIDAEANTAISNHGGAFISAFQYKNICGTQFHPEKSQAVGLKMIKNFIDMLQI